MKVIFLQEIKNIAKKGDVKNVNDGFARNYLIPRHLAVQSTASGERHALDIQREISFKAQHDKATNRKMRDSLDGQSISFVLKANESGTTFGGLSKQQILDRLIHEFSLNPEIVDIELEKPLKHTGDYRIPVSISSEKAHITVTISKKDE